MEESIDKTKGLKGLFTGCESGLLSAVEFSGIEFFEEENFILDVISYPKSFLLYREKLNFELETFGVERVSGQCFIGGWKIPGKRLSFNVIGQPVFSHAAVTGVVDPEPSVQHTEGLRFAKWYVEYCDGRCLDIDEVAADYVKWVLEGRPDEVDLSKGWKRWT